MKDELFKDFITTPEHRSNVLPLRWFGNFCNCYPAAWALHRALRHEDVAHHFDEPLSKAGHRWWKAYSIFNAPYERWGTIYKVDWHK